MIKLKVAQIGSSLCLVLPKEAVNKLNVAEGDEVFGIETEGGYHIAARDSQFEGQMGAARKIMNKRRKVLRQLGK